MNITNPSGGVIIIVSTVKQSLHFTAVLIVIDPALATRLTFITRWSFGFLIESGTGSEVRTSSGFWIGKSLLLFLVALSLLFVVCGVFVLCNQYHMGPSFSDVHLFFRDTYIVPQH